MASNADHHPRDGRLIKDKAQFKIEVGPASHLAEWRSWGRYYHHSLVVEVLEEGVKVIQYGLDGCSVRIHEHFLKFDCMQFKTGVYLIWSDGYPESNEEKEEAIGRARLRLREVKYMIAINNCEHFVTWALTGNPLSHQVANAKPIIMLGADALDAYPNKKVLTSTFPAIETMLEKGATKVAEKVAEKVEEVITEKIENEVIPILVAIAFKAKKEAAEKMVTKGIPALGGKVVETLGTEVVGKAVTKGAPALGGTAVETLGTAITEKAVTKGIPALGEKVVVTVGKSAAKAVGEKTATAAGKTVASKTGAVVAETTRKAVVNKVGTQGVQAGKVLMKKAAKTAMIRSNSTKSVLKATGKAAAITAVAESALLARDIYNLNESRKAGHMTERDFKRGVVTKTSGTVGSIAGSTAGTAIGQILIPVPVLGGFVGGLVGSLLVREVSSFLSGLVFDIA